MQEILDIVDENGEPTGETVEREFAHADGIRHRTSHVWLARERNGRVEILLQKRAENKAESLKKYLDSALQGSKFGTTRVDISYRKSTNVEVADIELLPNDYKKSITTVSADKVELAKALMAGEIINGATLIENNNIQIK